MEIPRLAWMVREISSSYLINLWETDKGGRTRDVIYNLEESADSSWVNKEISGFGSLSNRIRMEKEGFASVTLKPQADTSGCDNLGQPGGGQWAPGRPDYGASTRPNDTGRGRKSFTDTCIKSDQKEAHFQDVKCLRKGQRVGRLEKRLEKNYKILVRKKVNGWYMKWTRVTHSYLSRGGRSQHTQGRNHLGKTRRPLTASTGLNR